MNIQNQTYSFKKAFSMLELVFVIAILGIVSSIGAEIIAKTYESYIVQRAQHRASLKTELAATQIANRLAYAIPGTVVRRSALTTASEDINAPTITDHNILQWVGADIDSFNAVATTLSPYLPGWSGFADVGNIAPFVPTNTISTPGSSLGLAATIIGNLGGTVAGSTINYQITGNPLATQRTVSGLAGTTITLAANTIDISEHYKLAWTSYALEADTAGDLWLHYNFLPRTGTNITAHSSQLLLRNVSTFEFRGDGQTVRFKICVQEQITSGAGAQNNIATCKEKAVF